MLFSCCGLVAHVSNGLNIMDMKKQGNQFLNYCTGEERFTFIKLPKCLVEDECFIELSMDAKLLEQSLRESVSFNLKME